MSWIDFSKSKPKEGEKIDVCLNSTCRITDCVYFDKKIHYGSATIHIGKNLMWMKTPSFPNV